ncbi:hypothetical protein TEA_002711 [Camellia sinensis var. sinensis]|uniref:KHDC4/BBP-like KH-domain type I domain-containing protein n=1 Tax=Camellia sinensis var. sinensis TaxID=542762 RepID=A0A4V3WKQ7_CAMSN|nr:hypothetical protein TEA_002711 [Camellia sinensis var. sinensis]
MDHSFSPDHDVFPKFKQSSRVFVPYRDGFSSVYGLPTSSQISIITCLALDNTLESMDADVDAGTLTRQNLQRVGYGYGLHRFSAPQGIMDWHAAPGSPSSYIVKRILRLEIPVDSYPNFNFVGRLLGPRGNSLKRVEASTGCRVFIRGKGSIKDPDKVIFVSDS